MRLSFPPQYAPVADGKSEPMGRDWLQFIRLLWSALGWDRAVTIYSDLVVSPMQEGITTLDVVAGLKAKQVDGGVDSSVYATLRLPNSYKSGTDLKPFVEWTPSDAAVANVHWKLSYSFATSGETFDAAQSKEAITATSGDATKLVRTEIPDFVGADMVKGAVLLLRLDRLGATGNDTYAEPVGLLCFGVKYQVEGIGDSARY